MDKGLRNPDIPAAAVICVPCVSNRFYFMKPYVLHVTMLIRFMNINGFENAFGLIFFPRNCVARCDNALELI